jgi:hypothetical protein
VPCCKTATGSFRPPWPDFLLLITLVPGDWGRRPWGADYFGVELPAIAKPERAIVLMAGHDAMAYLIPFFPPPVRFLRIQGYVTGPSAEPNQTDRLMREIITRHEGALVHPVPGLRRVARHDGARRDYELEADPPACTLLCPGSSPSRSTFSLLRSEGSSPHERRPDERRHGRTIAWR